MLYRVDSTCLHHQWTLWCHLTKLLLQQNSLLYVTGFTGTIAVDKPHSRFALHVRCNLVKTSLLWNMFCLLAVVDDTQVSEYAIWTVSVASISLLKNLVDLMRYARIWYENKIVIYFHWQRDKVLLCGDHPCYVKALIFIYRSKLILPFWRSNCISVCKKALFWLVYFQRQYTGMVYCGYKHMILSGWYYHKSDCWDKCF